MLLLLVTLASMLLAAIMTAIAWRAAHEERRRSEARVAALAAEIDADLDVRPRAVPRPVTASPDLFAPHDAARSPLRAALMTAAVLVVGAIVAAAFVASPLKRTAPPPPAAASTPVAQPAVPLELVALGQERDGNRLTVRGVIRNPGSGHEIDALTAVVFVFSAEGGFVSSGRAAVESAALRPGGESTFVVSVPDAAAGNRYRVSFRTEDRIVPHVDAREHAAQQS